MCIRDRNGTMKRVGASRGVAGCDPSAVVMSTPDGVRIITGPDATIAMLVTLPRIRPR